MNDNSKLISSDVQIKNDGKLACHMFYANLHKDCFVSRSTTHYSKFSTPDVIDPQLVMLYSLIRNNLLQDSIKYGSLELVNMEGQYTCLYVHLPLAQSQVRQLPATFTVIVDCCKQLLNFVDHFLCHL